jgi:hypothetical protein
MGRGHGLEQFLAAAGGGQGRGLPPVQGEGVVRGLVQAEMFEDQPDVGVAPGFVRRGHGLEEGHPGGAAGQGRDDAEADQGGPATRLGGQDEKGHGHIASPTRRP